jgi:hypothetical protein
MPDQSFQEPKKPGIDKDAWDLYENGKHRRYSLMFTVNGAAFTVAQLLARPAAGADAVLGGLTLRDLALGMAVFTALMTWDIFAFGLNMRRGYLKQAFGAPGRIVLLALGALQIAGWLRAGSVW